MVPHPGGPGREDRECRATFALELQLRTLDAVPELVVADLQFVRPGRLGGVVQGCNLALAPGEESLRLGGVMAVAVNDEARHLRYRRRDLRLRLGCGKADYTRGNRTQKSAPRHAAGAARNAMNSHGRHERPPSGDAGAPALGPQPDRTKHPRLR